MHTNIAMRDAFGARRHLLMTSIAAVVLLAAGACGGGGSSPSGPPSGPSSAPPPTPPASNAVVVGNNSFSPNAITVAPGTTVTWNWNTCSSDPYGTGATCVDHSVTWDDGSTPSPTQSQGAYQRQFNTAGTFTYHCVMHGAAMSGKITVQ